MDQEIE